MDFGLFSVRGHRFPLRADHPVAMVTLVFCSFVGGTLIDVDVSGNALKSRIREWDMNFLKKMAVMLSFSLILAACATQAPSPDKPIRTNISTLPAQARAEAQGPSPVTQA